MARDRFIVKVQEWIELSGSVELLRNKVIKDRLELKQTGRDEQFPYSRALYEGREEAFNEVLKLLAEFKERHF